MCPWESPPDDDSDAVDAGIREPWLASGESLNASARSRGSRRGRWPASRRLLAQARGWAIGLAAHRRVRPGIGKTTLLNAARSSAGGFTTLSATGVASESVLAHAGLLELRESTSTARSRRYRRRRPLRSHPRWGWGSDEVPADRFLVGAATLSLLAAAAAEGPVLVVVDDLHWLDRESADAILFAARRLGPDAVAFVFATRGPAVGAGAEQGIPMVRVAGLSSTTASPDAAGGGRLPTVVDRLVEGTEGNPLALFEVTTRLDAAQRIGAAPLPEPLPVGERLHGLLRLSPVGVVCGRLASCVVPRRSRRRSCGGSDDGPRARRRRSRVRVRRGPAARCSGPPVIPTSPSGTRWSAAPCCSWRRRHSNEAAHRAVADALPADSPARTWHLAQATAGVDDQLADELDTARGDRPDPLGLRRRRRGPRTRRRPHRGRPRAGRGPARRRCRGRVPRRRRRPGLGLWWPGSGGTCSTDDVRGRALFVLGMLEQYAGSVPQAADHLTDAAELLSRDDAGPRADRARHGPIPAQRARRDRRSARPASTLRQISTTPSNEPARLLHRRGRPDPAR